jgi:hypothetical protein
MSFSSQLFKGTSQQGKSEGRRGRSEGGGGPLLELLLLSASSSSRARESASGCTAAGRAGDGRPEQRRPSLRGVASFNMSRHGDGAAEVDAITRRVSLFPSFSGSLSLTAW